MAEKKTFDILALGEILIDFTPHQADDGTMVYRRNPGGAPLNMLAQASVLGARTAFIGKAGRDGFGDYLEKTAREAGIDTEHLMRSDRVPTTLAFVHLAPDGERSFSFYRKPGADIMLEKEDLDPALFLKSHIFHFGSLSVTDEPARSATKEAIRLAKESGCILSYDANYRPALWEKEADAVAQMKGQIAFADIVKVSEEEMEMITGSKDPAEGTKEILALGVKMVCVTFGREGSFFRCGDRCGHVDSFPVNAVDTTGAGDAFWGAVLSRIRSYTADTLKEVSEAEWQDIIGYGNAAGALVASNYGAINSVRNDADIRKLMREGTAAF